MPVDWGLQYTVLFQSIRQSCIMAWGEFHSPCLTEKKYMQPLTWSSKLQVRATALYKSRRPYLKRKEKKNLDWSGMKQVAVLVCANMVLGQNRWAGEREKKTINYTCNVVCHHILIIVIHILSFCCHPGPQLRNLKSRTEKIRKFK